MEPERGAPSDNTTAVTELQGMRDDGYDADFFAVEGPGLRCGSCRTVLPADQLELDALRRLEGASDPADMAAILALTCPSCGQQGTAMVKYGPEATAEEDELLRALPDVDRDGGTAQLTGDG
jgi:hypothetical protein